MLRNQNRHLLSAKHCSPNRLRLKNQPPQALHKPLLTVPHVSLLNINLALFKTIPLPCFCQPQAALCPKAAL